jgi:hypothetical protein
MRIGKSPDKPSMRMGPSLGNYALDIPALSDSSAYAAYLALQVREEVLVAEERVTALEPPVITPQPVTSLDYSTFPSVETKDTVFATTPVVRLKSGTNVADQNSGTLTTIDVTYRPFMDNAWSGAVGVAVGTGTIIGTGGANTTAWEAAVTEWGSQSRIVLSFDFNGFNDWFIPSQDELLEIYDNLASFPNLTQAIADELVTLVCSSSEAAAPDDTIKLVAVDMTDGTTTDVLKLDQTTTEAGASQGAIIPVRAIFDIDGPFVVGDVGPGGGIVFYDNGVDDTWGRYLEAVDAVDGAWHYDLTEYNTFDADERFYPAGALDVYPYDGTGNWRVYPSSGICTFSGVGIASTLWFVDEMILDMRARAVSSGLQAPLQKVVVSGLVAP